MADTFNTIRMSFSGSDADVYCFCPGPGTVNQTSLIHLDSLQTLSVSVFREKIPVRALGFSNVISHTRGGRTVAGSMIFTVLNDHPLKEMFKKYLYDFSFDMNTAGSSINDSDHAFPDVIPPFHMIVQYKNELGNAAVLEILGVDITNDGIVTSVEDLITENSIQYVARDLRIFKGITGKNGLGPGQTSNLLEETVEDIINSSSDVLNGGVKILDPVPQATTRSLASLMSSTKRSNV